MEVIMEVILEMKMMTMIIDSAPVGRKLPSRQVFLGLLFLLFGVFDLRLHPLKHEVDGGIEKQRLQLHHRRRRRRLQHLNVVLTRGKTKAIQSMKS